VKNWSQLLSSRRAPRVSGGAATRETPPWGRVGIVAVVGFLIGVAWPRLAGVQLVPEAPSEDVDLTEASPASATAATAGSAAAPAPTVAAVESTQRIKVEFAEIGSCRGADGKKVKACGALELDSVVTDRLQSLSGCEAARGVEGTLSLMMMADFAKERFTAFQAGKSTTLPRTAAESILNCAEREFAAASLRGVDHEQQQYEVYYYVHFLGTERPGGAGVDGAAATAEGVTTATGAATVVWATALVRAEPAQDGRIVARLGSGTRVVVTAKKASWYRVKYDARGTEGWVFGKAVGL
jgi:hypothetical protein